VVYGETPPVPTGLPFEQVPQPVFVASMKLFGGVTSHEGSSVLELDSDELEEVVLVAGLVVEEVPLDDVEDPDLEDE
jgi:hypothetical protein